MRVEYRSVIGLSVLVRKGGVLCFDMLERCRVLGWTVAMLEGVIWNIRKTISRKLFLIIWGPNHYSA